MFGDTNFLFTKMATVLFFFTVLYILFRSRVSFLISFAKQVKTETEYGNQNTTKYTTLDYADSNKDAMSKITGAFSDAIENSSSDWFKFY